MTSTENLLQDLEKRGEMPSRLSDPSRAGQLCSLTFEDCAPPLTQTCVLSSWLSVSPEVPRLDLSGWQSWKAGERLEPENSDSTVTNGSSMKHIECQSQNVEIPPSKFYF